MHNTRRAAFAVAAGVLAMGAAAQGPGFLSGWYDAPPGAYAARDANGRVIPAKARLVCHVDASQQVSGCQAQSVSRPGVGVDTAALAFFGKPEVTDLLPTSLTPRPVGEPVTADVYFDSNLSNGGLTTLISVRFGAGAPADPVDLAPDLPTVAPSPPLPWPSPPPSSLPSISSPPPLPPPPPRPSVVTNPNWIAKPTGSEFAGAYPANAAHAEMSGRAVISCAITTEGALSACEVVSESPPGWGFGAAALKVAPYFRMSPATPDGQPVAGRRIRVPMRWMLAG